MSLAHAAFLHDMQEWVWKRFPTRQLSATDVQQVLQWAETAIPSCILIDGLESWIHAHPGKFESDGRLTSLRFEAGRIIDAYRTAAPAPVQPLRLDDPYAVALDQIADVGRKTDNPLLRDALRGFYQRMRESRRTAQDRYPLWNRRSEQYYPLKAQAILDWDGGLHGLAETCLGLLSDAERAAIETPSPSETMHCMFLGDEAKAVYLDRQRLRKTAEYFGFAGLLSIL